MISLRIVINPLRSKPTRVLAHNTGQGARTKFWVDKTLLPGETSWKNEVSQEQEKMLANLANGKT